MCGGADQGYALANSPRAMARLRKPRRRMAWSVDNASTFAAQKEFKLLQLLSTDKKAFATARRSLLAQLQAAATADRKVWCRWCVSLSLGSPQARWSIGPSVGAQQPPATQRRA